MANILITGGSGLVGRAISQLLLSNGHEVRWLSRESGKEGTIIKYKWDVDSQYIDEHAFEHVDAIIHLAGAGIVEKRWTESYKQEIYDSRIKSSELLYTYINKLNTNLTAFVGGSAIGYYGSETSTHIFAENSPPGIDFLGSVCLAWEISYEPLSQLGIRTCIIRTGIVLSDKGGAYAKMKPIFNLGLGAGIGKGNQAFPWIHLKDLAAIFVRALFDNTMKGAYNAVATSTTTNIEFSKALANSLHRPCVMPNIPSLLLNWVMGERSVTLTKGKHIDNSKIKLASYTFQFENLELALHDLIKPH